MISMPEIKMGNNSANNVSGVTTFNLCKMAGHALYCTKFCETRKSVHRTRMPPPNATQKKGLYVTVTGIP